MALEKERTPFPGSFSDYCAFLDSIWVAMVRLWRKHLPVLGVTVLLCVLVRAIPFIPFELTGDEPWLLWAVLPLSIMRQVFFYAFLLIAFWIILRLVCGKRAWPGPGWRRALGIALWRMFLCAMGITVLVEGAMWALLLPMQEFDLGSNPIFVEIVFGLNWLLFAFCWFRLALYCLGPLTDGAASVGEAWRRSHGLFLRYVVPPFLMAEALQLGSCYMSFASEWGILEMRLLWAGYYTVLISYAAVWFALVRGPKDVFQTPE